MSEGKDVSGVSRREFVEIAGSAILTLSTEPAWAREPADGEVPRRALGRTGERVSIVGVGGFHLGKADEDEAIRIVRTALDAGINFMDNCWDYHNGQSEIRMGKALRDGYRAKAFLMTKIDGRNRTTFTRQLDESLQRLQTDHVDLLQFHEIIRLSDPDRIFAPDGALQAALDAKRAGKLRYIGFTGHKSPAIHLKMLETASAHDFHFDTVQLPLNVMDAHYDSFERRVLPELVKRRIGVLGMKPMGDPFILGSGTVSAMECLHYSMSLPVSVVITGCDSLAILEQALTAARSFKPMSKARVARLLARTAKGAENGQFERYKTSDHFDGTAKHPEWLG